MTKQHAVNVSERSKSKLNQLKVHPRESYGDVIDKLIQEHMELATVKEERFPTQPLLGTEPEHLGPDNLTHEQAAEIANTIHKETQTPAQKQLLESKDRNNKEMQD